MAKRGPKPNIEARFLAQVRVGLPDECWEWQGRCDSHGYPTTWSNGKNIKPYRYAYEYWVGSIPEGMCVCHRCDNPKCCNPAHLFLGTQLDNIADCISKGRNVKGERCHTAKLTEEDVRIIRSLKAAGTFNQRELADMFGVDPSVVSEIVHYKTWKHLEEVS